MEETIRTWLSELPMTPVALLLVMAAALLEYVFPPFPGDTVVLFAAFLAGSADTNWEPLPVWLAVSVGNLLGMAVDYEFGRWMSRHDHEWRQRWRWWARAGSALDRLLPHFQRQATYFLLCNRFLPSVRALLFVAAGMTNVPRWRVLLLGGISALAWSLLLFVVGLWLGRDWPALLEFIQNYNRGAWVVLSGLLILWWGYRWWRPRSPNDNVSAQQS